MTESNAFETTNISDRDLQITSLEDLNTLSSVYDSSGVLLYYTFSFFDNDDNVYFGQSSMRKLDVEGVKKALEPVPDEKIFPKPPPHVKIVPFPREGEFYIKRPKLGSYEDHKDTGLLPRMLIDEVEILERLMQNQHPNLVRYHGCIVNRGYITGIVLDRYPITLRALVEDGVQGFNKELVIQGVESGVKHLHSLGLAFNDLNPNNIMVRNNIPIIIDFGSCKPFGEQLISGGTPGWIEEDFMTSEKKHDEFALVKLRKWLDGERVVSLL